MQILEECGYDVQTSDIEPITTYVGSAGKSGAVSHLFAAKVIEAQASCAPAKCVSRSHE